MIDPSLAIQKAIYRRLSVANPIPHSDAYSPGINALYPGQTTALQYSSVPVFDKAGLPTVFPAIIIGEAHVIWPDYYEDFAITVHCDLHIWTDKPDLASVKHIAGKVREALWLGPWEIDGHHCVNLRIQDSRFMRDPDKVHSHGVLSITAILQENRTPR